MTFKGELNSNILFSIITVCYNADEVLKDTIRSVIDQNCNQFEYIIIDGGSTDNSLEIINKFKDKIDSFTSEPDRGIYDAMNKGLKLAKGHFVNFLNAGDRFVSKTILSEIGQQININKVKIISGDFILTNSYNNNERIIQTRKITHDNLKKDFYSCHQSIFINRKIAMQYDISYKIKADYKWVINALNNTNESCVYKFNEPIVYYSKQGFSHRFFFKNIIELIRLHYEFYGPLQVLKNAHIYIYRFTRSIKDYFKG
jgi:glycosyltransferase involved in cell wall biosynthesis